MTSLEDIKQKTDAVEFMKQMAEKYDLIFVPSLESIYIKYNDNDPIDYANYQVVALRSNSYRVYPVCEIKGNEIITSNDEKTWADVNSNSMLEKYLMEFKKNYKEAQLKLKIKTIEKDF